MRLTECSLLTGIVQLKNAISGGASHDAIERFPPPRCHPETRTAVLEHIHQWIQTSEPTSKILWLHGPAGAGKSAIAQTIAEQTEEKELAASFFFSRGKPGRDSSTLLWATIAFQLAKSIPEIRDGIGGTVVRHPDIVQKSLEIQWKNLIVDPLSSVMGTDLPSDSPFLVIIDGLDECSGDRSQCNILEAITRFVTFFRLPLRFLIASRPEPHIQSSFDNDPLQQLSLRLSLDDSFLPVRDVFVYLRHEFDRIYNTHRHIMGSISRPWPSDNIVQLLAKRSSGQFVYASTVLRFIDDLDRRPTDQLRIVLNASGSAAFTELDQLYQQILSTCNNKALLLQILGCILVATYPLSACQIEGLLSLHEGDVYLTLRRMHSILRVPANPLQPILVLHASFGDFIFNAERAGDYHIHEGRCNAYMARCCADYATRPAGDRFVFCFFHSKIERE